MFKSSDARNQPTTVAFNRARKKLNQPGNIDKAAYVLKGIVDGVNVDENLVDTEILYLDAWMRSQDSLGLQIVAFDLYQAVNRVLEDQNASADEHADLNQLIQSTLEVDGESRTPDDELPIKEFVNMVEAICTDGIIMHPKITGVEAWLTANKDISKAPTTKPVYCKVHDVLKDKIIDKNKPAGLDELVADMSGDAPVSQSGGGW